MPHQIHSRLSPDHRYTYAAIAAGEGFASLLSVTKAILEGEPNSRLLVFYGNRDVAGVPQLEELQGFKDRYLGRLSLYFFFSEEPQDVELFNGALDAKKIEELARSVFDPKTVRDVYLCGPQELNHAAAETLKTLGIDASHIHGDRTEEPAAAAGAAGKSTAGAPVADAKTTQVTVLIDGRRRNFSMPLNGAETVLDAAERCGLDLPFSCRAAVCSTCRTKVVKGSVEMAQNYALESWEVEEGYILACQAKPTSPELELDYDDK